LLHALGELKHQICEGGLAVGWPNLHQEKFLRPETAEQAGRTGRRELSPDGSRRLGEEHSHSVDQTLKYQKMRTH
jgi:hypothetical protein